MNSFYFIFSKTNLQNRFLKQILKTKIEKRSKQTLDVSIVRSMNIKHLSMGLANKNKQISKENHISFKKIQIQTMSY